MKEDRWRVDDVLTEFIALKDIADATREALAEAILQEMLHQTPTFGFERVRDALKYLEEVREGFTLSVRADVVADRRELAYLVNQLLVNWEWLADMGIDLAPPEAIASVGRQLVAFAMAAVALAFMPELPPQAVTFPLRHQFPTPSYADIRVPRSPGEVWDRLEEIERVVYTAGLRPLSSVHPSPLRRTYAFFEANAWLAEQQVQRFLGGSRSREA